MLFLVVPPLALIIRWVRFGPPAPGAVAARLVLDSTLLSLCTTAITMLIVVVFGTALAYLLSQGRFPLFRALSVFVELPIVMPPAVAGLALLAAFGRQGLLAGLMGQTRLRVTFTPLAVILAQLFVSSPYYIRAAQARFSAVPRELFDAAGLDGANGLKTFWHVTLPVSRRALLSALSLTWSRALGEFGATILVAGSLPRRTQTMTLLVYSALERDLHASFTVAILLLALAAVALAAVRYLARLDRHEEMS
jgi:molybdate transport system permease protein